MCSAFEARIEHEAEIHREKAVLKVIVDEIREFLIFPNDQPILEAVSSFFCFATGSDLCVLSQAQVILMRLFVRFEAV